jgi:phosphoserine phosphatase RsbU/P
MPRWRMAAASLSPLVAAGVVVLLHGRGIPGSLLLLIAVAFTYLFAGLLAGVTSLALAAVLYGTVVLPVRGTVQALSWDALGFDTAFVLTGGGLIAVLSRLRAAASRADSARQAAERRAREFADRIDLIGPMLDAAPIGFALVDADLRYQYVNKRLAEINGVPEAAHIGHRPSEIFGAELAGALEEPVREVLVTGRPQPDETAIHVVDGRSRHFIGGRHPVRDDDGQVVGVIITVLEVTDQVLLQREVVRTAAELRATIESSPFAIALVDTGLRYQQVNDAYRALCRTGDDPTGQELTACELPVGVLDSCRRALAERQPIDAETTAEGPDGTARDLSVSCYPVHLEDEVIGVAVMLVDITERHRLAQLELEAASLRATAELAFKLEEAQRLAGYASWEIDVATGKLSYSPQLSAIIGVERTDYESLAAVGASVHPDDVDRVRAARDELLAHHTPFRLEYRLIRPDGRVLDVMSSGEAVRDESGEVVRVWGTIQDVTEQRAAERAARDAVRHAEQARADLEVEHQALQMFQRAMLPAELPEVRAVDLFAVYLPMAERIDIGGDWYDAFLLPDGRLALAVGDVTGHDLRAATVMGQVRNAVRAYATETPEPGAVLARLNALLGRLPDLDLVTMLFGVYDPVTHELVWSNAGHPAPLLRRGRTVTALTVEGGLLLGVVPGEEPYPEHRLRLEPEDTVLWYTDGIIDHRSIDPLVAIEQLSQAFAEASGDADELLSAVSADMLSDGEREDDVCLLALRRTGDPVDGASVRAAKTIRPPVDDVAATDERADSRTAAGIAGSSVVSRSDPADGSSAVSRVGPADGSSVTAPQSYPVAGALDVSVREVLAVP